MKIIVGLLVVVVLALACHTLGFQAGWREVSKIIGCYGEFPYVQDVVDYIRTDDGRIQRYMCAERIIR